MASLLKIIFNILQEAIYTSGVSNADDYNNISKNNMKDPSQYVAQKANPFYISMIKHSLHEYLGGAFLKQQVLERKPSLSGLMNC